MKISPGLDRKIRLQIFDFEKRSRHNLSDFGSPLRLITLRFRLWEKRQIFAVTLFLQLLHRNETQRGRIDAITFTGWRRPILKDMTEMRIAFA